MKRANCKITNEIIVIDDFKNKLQKTNEILSSMAISEFFEFYPWSRKNVKLLVSPQLIKGLFFRAESKSPG